MEVVRGEEDRTLTARVVSRTPLLYGAGPDASLDRPAHVRAASGAAWAGGRLAIVQDDALFVAFVDPTCRRVEALPLPAGAGGERLFDDRRGNKARKLDLEACVADGDLLVAFGSGSTRERERLVLLRGTEASLAHVPRWYEGLRAHGDFAGSGLNIEGAILLGDVLRLFHRGNDAPRAGQSPCDATCDVDWRPLLDHVARGTPPPTPGRVSRYDLGAIDGVRLGFTDAALRGSEVWFLAAAEASPDAVRDGPVAGSVLGRIGDDHARWTRILDERGRPIRGKAEGLAFPPGDPGRAYVVFDHDDPEVPSEWTEIVVDGA